MCRSTSVLMVQKLVPYTMLALPYLSVSTGSHSKKIRDIFMVPMVYVGRGYCERIYMQLGINTHRYTVAISIVHVVCEWSYFRKKIS